MVGTLERNTERKDSFLDWNLSIEKYFALSAETQVQFRVEIFNLFGIANLNKVDNILISPTFRSCLSAFEPRRIQLALQIFFQAITTHIIHYGNSGLRLVVSLLVLSACSSLQTTETLPEISIQFEEHPRSILNLPGIETSRDPKVRLRASGAVYLLAPYTNGKDQHLGLFISRDGGDRFALPVSVNPKGSTVISHGENSPTLAFGARMEVYALWEKNEPHGRRSLVVSRSMRFGHRFESPVQVTDKTTPSSNAFSFLAVAPNGDLYVVWLDGRDPQARKAGKSSVYLSRSQDQGRTFGKNKLVYSQVCPCCRPTLAFGSKNQVYVSWRHVFDGNIRDVVVASSHDGGNSFSEPVRVSHDNWEISGCPHSGSSLISSGNRLYVAWFSDPRDRAPGIQLSWSSNDGKTFADPVPVSRTLVDANHPYLAQAKDGQILLVFQGRDSEVNQSWGPTRPYLVQIDPNNGPSKPLPIPGSGASISYPFVTSGGQDRIYVCWTQRGKQGPNVILSRGRRTL